MGNHLTIGDNGRLLRRTESGDKHLALGCTEYPIGAGITQICNGCLDTESINTLGSGWSNMFEGTDRTTAPLCAGTDSIACNWRITLSGLTATTEGVYCNATTYCSDVEGWELWGGSLEPKYLCGTSFVGIGEERTIPRNDINGTFEAPTLLQMSDADGFHVCCKSVLLPSVFTVDPDDYSTCGPRTDIDTIDMINWHLTLVIFFWNMDDALITWKYKTGQPQPGDRSFVVPNGVKLHLIARPFVGLAADVFCTREQHDEGEPNSFQPHGCLSENEDGFTDNDPYYAEQQDWFASNVFKGVLPNFDCFGKNVFHNQILNGEPRGVQYCKGNIENLPAVQIPLYYGGTVTLEAIDI